MSKRNRSRVTKAVTPVKGDSASGTVEVTEPKVQEQQPVVSEKAAGPSEPQAQPGAEEPLPHTIADFLTTARAKRKHQTRQSFRKDARHKLLVEFWQGFTEHFITGKIPDNDIKILSDSKRFLYAQPDNPFNLKNPKTGDANSFVQQDMVEICIEGFDLGPDTIKLSARTVGKNRVMYFDRILGQKLINENGLSADEKTERQSRFNILDAYPVRDGYRSSP